MTDEKDPSGNALAARYRGLVCDLDGVVYRGSHAVPGAVETVRSAVRGGCRVAFATNNASRTPDEVLAHLGRIGVDVESRSARESVVAVTSAQAAARLARKQVAAGSPVLAVGGEGVGHALSAVGLEPFAAVDSAQFAEAAVVVQGAGPAVSWRDLAEAAFRIQAGALWIVTNQDRTIPTSRGLAPGNGALAAAVRGAVDVEPQVAGKPGPGLYELAMDWLDVPRSEVLAVGDRLDTDVAGAHAAGLDSLFVLGGAHGLGDLVWCPPRVRPTHVGADLRALATSVGEPSVLAYDAIVVNSTGSVEVRALGSVSPSGALDAVVRAAWSMVDDGHPLPEGTRAWRDLEQRITSVMALTP
jgi:glycerol-1-phosphatase